MTREEDFEAALARFKAFHKRDPRNGEILQVQNRADDAAFAVGELFGISYCVPDETTPYFHEFPKSNRPLLALSSDGKQAYILKGGYTFTDRGFEK